MSYSWVFKSLHASEKGQARLRSPHPRSTCKHANNNAATLIPATQLEPTTSPPASAHSSTSTSTPASPPESQAGVLSNIFPVMAGRNYATPMDFEYENKHGQIDPSSPFVNFKGQHSSFASSQGDLGSNWRLQGSVDSARASQNHAGKRAYAQYNSPQKQDTPSLRPPNNGSSFLFSEVDVNKKLPPSPGKSASPTKTKLTGSALWNTPRNSRVVDFSSGGETPDTENWKADSEATPDTPSMGLRKQFTSLFSSGGKKGKEMAVSKGSPGKGEIAPAKPYSQKVAKKVQKKRREEQSSKRRRLLKNVGFGSDTEPDTDAGADREDARQPKGDGWSIGSTFAWIESHPNLPHVLSYYVQFFANLCIVGGFLWILWGFWGAIVSDVNKKSDEAMAGVLHEIAQCAKEWRDNRCDGNTLPGLVIACSEWEKCMNRDHKQIGRARVSAHTFAEIFNSFIEPISWKAMLFTAVIVVATFGATNGAFSLFRRNLPEPHPHYQHPVPPTPQRHPSWGVDHQYGFTPYSSQYGLPPPQWHNSGELEPMPSQSSQGSPKKTRERMGSPRKVKMLE